MMNDSKQKTKIVAQKFKIDKRKKGSDEYLKLSQFTKSNRRITITEKKFSEEKDLDQSNSVLKIYDFDDEADFSRIKLTIKFEAELQVSVVKKSDLWYRKIKNHVQKWKSYVDEIHQNSDIMKQNLKKTQVSAQRYQIE